VIGAFLLGGVIGAILGLLFSPRSGRENREMIADAAQRYMEEGKDLYETGRTRVTEVYESGRDVASEKADELRHKIDTARDRLKEQVADTVPVAKDKVVAAGDSVKRGVDTAQVKATGALDSLGEKARKTEGAAGDTATES
jgi:gas vesicle protein